MHTNLALSCLGGVFLVLLLFHFGRWGFMAKPERQLSGRPALSSRRLPVLAKAERVNRNSLGHVPAALRSQPPVHLTPERGRNHDLAFHES